MTGARDVLSRASGIFLNQSCNTPPPQLGNDATPETTNLRGARDSDALLGIFLNFLLLFAELNVYIILLDMCTEL